LLHFLGLFCQSGRAGMRYPRWTHFLTKRNQRAKAEEFQLRRSMSACALRRGHGFVTASIADQHWNAMDGVPKHPF
jgi:hypothetical protein